MRSRLPTIDNAVISVTGLGYVGLPVAVGFARKFPVIGFDLKKSRIRDLIEGVDRTGEVSSETFSSIRATFTDDPRELSGANFHIIAVPTPVDDSNRPDLSALIAASESVARSLKRGDVVVYESTVYPGCTEEVCAPILERLSGLRLGHDFGLGFSPERINPGDRDHTLEKITKVVSGDSPTSLDSIAEIYGSIVPRLHRAQSIKVAEAAKIIENTQRDLNIALVNELAMIFDRMGIDTTEVLEAAGTKWNFLKFTPGLVGGHCIGVDPYYLTYQAQRLGYAPQVILAGRQVNDGLSKFIADCIVKSMLRNGLSVKGNTVTFLGVTFKENVPDVRNSKAVDVIRELASYGLNIQLCDPVADPEDVQHEYGLKLTRWDDLQVSDCVVVAVAHDRFKALTADDLSRLLGANPIVFDIKSILKKSELEQRGFKVWRL